jgi:ankyrin repeat protein
LREQVEKPPRKYEIMGREHIRSLNVFDGRRCREVVRVRMAPDMEFCMEIDLPGIDENSRDHDVQLHKAVVHAAFKGEKELVKHLIDGGAHVDARTKGSFLKQGDTPPKLAAEAGHGDMVDLLKQYGAQE